MRILWQEAKTTTDHVPPRSWFPDIVEYQLITVPSCRPCNDGWAADAEYMRNVLMIDYRTRSNVSTDELRARVLRGFAHHRGGGPTKSILKTMRRVEMRSPAGLVIGKTGSFEPDVGNLERVCSQIVRGLYWQHSGERLLETHSVGAYLVSAYTPTDDEQRESIQQLISIGLGGNYRQLGDVFEYDYRLVEAGASAWVMQFYGTFVAIAVTVNKTDAPRH